MALDFGKLNFSTAFNPTAAFPLDARCYFESKTAAETAVAAAEEVGSSNTVYFYGQQIAVFENGTATLYIINKEAQGTEPETYKGVLKEVGSQPVGDDNTVALVDGKLTLVGFADATNKQVPSKDAATGKIVWSDISGLIPGAVVPVTDNETINVTQDATDNNKYIISIKGKEAALTGAVLRKHVTQEEGQDPVTTYTWDVIYSAAEVDTLLANKVDKVDGKGLSTNDYTTDEQTKLAGIAEGAQVNVIETIKVNGTEQTVTDKAIDITIEAQAEYTIAKNETAEEGYAATYKLTKDGTQVGASINIPKDMVVESGSVKTCTEADKPVAGYKVGDKYIDLVLANTTDQHLYILVSDLVDTYTQGTGISIADNVISVDTTTIATKKSVDDIVDGTTTVAKATTATQVSDGTNTYAATDIKTIADKVDGITAGATKVAASETNGNIKIDDTETTVYTLPTDVVQDSDYTTKAATWAAKQDALTGNNGIEITADNKVQIVADLILDGGNAGAPAATEEPDAEPQE